MSCAIPSYSPYIDCVYVQKLQHYSSINKLEKKMADEYLPSADLNAATDGEDTETVVSSKGIK
jgi:hypothetical protein